MDSVKLDSGFGVHTRMPWISCGPVSLTASCLERNWLSSNEAKRDRSISRSLFQILYVLVTLMGDIDVVVVVPMAQGSIISAMEYPTFPIRKQASTSKRRPRTYVIALFPPKEVPCRCNSGTGASFYTPNKKTTDLSHATLETLEIPKPNRHQTIHCQASWPRLQLVLSSRSRSWLQGWKLEQPSPLRHPPNL